MPKSERPQPALGLAIHQLRIKRGAKQKDIADATGLTRRTLSLIEHGGANPTWATVRDIADALEVSMSELAKLAESSKIESSVEGQKSASQSLHPARRDSRKRLPRAATTENAPPGRRGASGVTTGRRVGFPPATQSVALDKRKIALRAGFWLAPFSLHLIPH